MTILEMNDLFEILCLKISIPSNVPIVPPKKAADNKVNSETLRRCLTAWRLSIQKRTKLMALIRSRI